MSVDELKNLHAALVDTKKGYEEAVKDTDDPTTAEIFRSMLALRERDHAELHEKLLHSGERPSDEGSFMGTVHETAISIRAAITGLGKNALGAFISGEEQVLEKYKAAIAEAEGDDSLTAILRRQQGELQSKVGEMKQISQ